MADVLSIAPAIGVNRNYRASLADKQTELPVSNLKDVEHIRPNQGWGMILYTPPQNHVLEPLCRNGRRTQNVNR